MAVMQAVDVPDLTVKLVHRDLEDCQPAPVLYNYMREFPAVSLSVAKKNHRQQLAMMVIGRTLLIMAAITNERIVFANPKQDILSLLYNFGYNQLDDELLGAAVYTVNYVANRDKENIKPDQIESVKAIAQHLNSMYGSKPTLQGEDCETPAFLLSYSIYDIRPDLDD